MSYFNKKRFTMRQVVGLLTVMFLAITAFAYAVTANFTSGTTISSTAVSNAINQNRSVSKCSAVGGDVLLKLNTDTFVNSVIITVPGPGTILVSGSGTLALLSDGTLDWAGGTWLDDNSGSGAHYGDTSWSGAAAWPKIFYMVPFHNQGSFIVGAAGTYTYNLKGITALNSQGVRALESSICAVFTPS